MTGLMAMAVVLLRLLEGPVHLRSGSEREWHEFPEQSRGPVLQHTFDAEANATEHTLLIRQRDVKSDAWTVSVNGHRIGTLLADERDMTSAFAVPAGTLMNGGNALEISGLKARFSDDVELKSIRLVRQPVSDYLRQARVAIETETDGERLPVRITVVNAEGSLFPIAALRESDREATRTGVVYTLDGRTEVGLPAGEYEIYASRGWEYSAPRQRVRLHAGKNRTIRLRLTREVALPGYVSCDTHVHTLELSGHGDASVRERVITAAGEGVDIVAATEHNRNADYSDMVRQLGLERRLVIVRGNEVTTALGHFNIFPLRPEAAAPDPKPADWTALARGVMTTLGVQVIVQNHPRDLHAGNRPFDPRHHLASAGQNLIGRPWFANGVEVVNSGAFHSDMLRPVLDWLGLLNRGYRVAAIGGSDTHTVDFVPIANARTYIDVAPLKGDWRGNLPAVFDRLAAGENLVAYGLAADMRLVRAAPERAVADIEVHGPSWSRADRVAVYANGLPVAEYEVPLSIAAGLKWRRRVEVKLPAHDVTLVAVATGPGVLRPFWEVRKPYQPVSKDWKPRVMGVSKALRLDVDGGGYKSPFDYAGALLAQYKDAELVRALGRYDASVTVQALTALALRGETIELPPDAPPSVRTGHAVFTSEWRKRE
jgi:hypothetical protein